MNKEILQCEDCKEYDDTVKERNCPYDEEMNGRETKVTICNSCNYDREQDI